jgi:hypothetical protein
MTLEEIAAELLEAPLRDFIARRSDRVRELKAAGQRELAGQVGALRKPPVALWAVNQVAHRDPESLERLRRAEEEATRAQRAVVGGGSGSAGELRQASSRLQGELERAAQAAIEALRQDGHAADEATERRLREMLRVTAVSPGEVWERLRQGALLSEPRAGEEMLTAAFEIGSPFQTAAPPPRPSPIKREGAAQRRDEDERRRRLEAEQALRVARIDAERAQELRQTARRLRQQADSAAADARRAEERARAAERELEEAAAKAKASEAAARRFRR